MIADLPFLKLVIFSVFYRDILGAHGDSRGPCRWDNLFVACQGFSFAITSSRHYTPCWSTPSQPQCKLTLGRTNNKNLTSNNPFTVASEGWNKKDRDRRAHIETILNVAPGQCLMLWLGPHCWPEPARSRRSIRMLMLARCG